MRSTSSWWQSSARSVSNIRQSSEYSFWIEATRGRPRASARRSHSAVPQAVSFDRPQARTLPAFTMSSIASSTPFMWSSISAFEGWVRGSKPQLRRKA